MKRYFLDVIGQPMYHFTGLLYVIVFVFILCRRGLFLKFIKNRKVLKGPLIVVSNHISEADSWTIGVSTRTPFSFFSFPTIRWFAKCELLQWEDVRNRYVIPALHLRASRIVLDGLTIVFLWTFSRCGLILVDRKKPKAAINRKAMCTALKTLSSDGIVGIYLEKGINTTGEQKEVSSSAVALARNSGATILPVSITHGGLLVFGEEIRIPPSISRAEISTVSGQIMERIWAKVA